MNHLPECTASHQHVDYLCICEQLRACEQRVENRIIHGGLDTARFNAGLDAAWEAVAEVDDSPKDHPYWIDREAALAAIDALKEKP